MASLSTLTWVLMILAFTVIGGVLVFNFLQEKKQNPKTVDDLRVKPSVSKAAPRVAEQTFATNSGIPSLNDVLPTEETAPAQSHFVGNRIEQSASSEPSLGVLTQYMGDSEGAVKVPTNDTAEWSSAAEAAAAAQALNVNTDIGVHASSDLNLALATQEADHSTLPASVLSDDFDYLIEFALPSLQSGERLIALTAAHRRAGGKPIAFDGLLSTGQWVILQPGELYIALRAGLLLANRHGPLNAMEFSDFGNFAQALSKQLDCEVALADMPRILSRARDVDRRCAELDAQLGISIQTSSVTSPAMLSAVAVEQGLTERGGGRFAKLDENGGTLFTLSFGEQGDKLAMLLDVPRANAQHRPWQQMLQCADVLAQRLDGQLVDDTGKPLPPGVWGQIEEQLRQRYWALDAAGIEPGSARALRLFN
jgi:ZipA, C-terminal FtsZ-binding domain